jgi:hypothetical protein
MTAKGFCTCERDFPGRYPVPANATWHYLCGKPIHPDRWTGPAHVPTGTGWPVSA